MSGMGSDSSAKLNVETGLSLLISSEFNTSLLKSIKAIQQNAIRFPNYEGYP
jgi:hypothetical protein